MPICIIISNHNKQTVNDLRSILTKKIEVSCIFLIFDAVNLAKDNDFIKTLEQHNLTATLCSSAADKRGINSKDINNNIFGISSIAYFVDKADLAEKVVQI